LGKSLFLDRILVFSIGRFFNRVSVNVVHIRHHARSRL